MGTEVAERTITIEPAAVPVTVRFAGRDIVSTDAALVLREGDYAPVLYLPREDADMSVFERSTHTTHCPYKGDASYFTLAVGDTRAENAVWSYEAPIDGVAAIRGYVSFYAKVVEIRGGF